jgi:hypothetical protein
VATLGRETLAVSLPADATLLALAHAVEDAWGVAVADQAFRWRGSSLAPGDKEAAKRRLADDHGFSLPPARPSRVLLSAGAPAGAAGPAAPTGGLATAVRAPTQVQTVTEEAPPPLLLRPPPPGEQSDDAAAPAQQQPAPPAAPAPAAAPFSGQGRRLTDTAEGAAELTPAQRRERAASAAAARAAAHANAGA